MALLLGAASTGWAVSSHNTSSPKPPPVKTPPKPAANPPAPTPVAKPRPPRPVPKPGHLPPQKALPKVSAPGDITNPGFESGDITGWTIGATCTPYGEDLFP